MTLGEKLKLCRTDKGLSQEKIAELVGVSRQAVAKWGSDKTTPSSDNLIALSAMYEISLDELVSQKHSAPQENHAPNKDKTILHTNLTLIAIIMQTAFLNAAMQPLQSGASPLMQSLEWVIKFVPLLAASIWMACNLRYEKNAEQYRKNTKIELLYCLVQAAVAMLGHYSRLYWLGTLLLIAVALGYIFVVNPKYMNRQLTKKKEV